MIEEVVSIELPVHERMVIKKNRLTPKDYAGEPVPRISIVTGRYQSLMGSMCATKS